MAGMRTMSKSSKKSRVKSRGPRGDREKTTSHKAKADHSRKAIQGPKRPAQLLLRIRLLQLCMLLVSLGTIEEFLSKLTAITQPKTKRRRTNHYIPPGRQKRNSKKNRIRPSYRLKGRRLCFKPIPVFTYLSPPHRMQNR